MLHTRLFRCSEVYICLNECYLSTFLLLEIFGWMLLRCFVAYGNIWLNVTWGAFACFKCLKISFIKNKIKIKTVLITSISTLLMC